VNTAQQTLLDVISPPTGFKFIRGIWLTHDIQISTLNDLLLPTLAGLKTTDRSATVVAPSIVGSVGGEAPLIVLAAGDRITPDTFLPADVFRLIPVTGRRQHAKVALLEYQRSEAPLDPTQLRSPRSALLTVIMSANLTRQGLTRNREVFATEWLHSNDTGPTIAIPVRDAIDGLAEQMPGTDAIAIQRLLSGFTVPQGAQPDTDRIAHSLTGSLPESFPAKMHRYADTGERPQRLVIAGPVFAGNAADVAREVSPLLSKSTKVDLVVNSMDQARALRDGAHVKVPEGFVDGLRKRSSQVRVWGAAVDDPGVPLRRALHGKSLVAQYPDRTIQLLGSANMTRRGLRGRNRELVIFLSVPVGSCQDCLDSLHAVELQHQQIKPADDPDSLPPKVDETDVPVFAEFVPDAGQDASANTLSGTLTVNGSGAKSIWVGSQKYDLMDGKAHVLISGDDLSVFVQQGHKRRPVLVRLTPSDGFAFWSRTPLDITTEKTDPLLARLKADVSHARRVSHRTSGQRTAANSASDDAFRLPAQVRLNVLARYRSAFSELDDQEAAKIRDEYFNDLPERRVADVLIAAARGSTDLSSLSPLLRALGDVADTTKEARNVS
jgi:hypothetical protein